jgi:hypothetical protein
MPFNWPNPPEGPNRHLCHCKHCRWRREIAVLAIEERTASLEAAIKANDRALERMKDASNTSQGELSDVEYQFRRACTE